MAKKVITVDQIEKYNKMVEASIGTAAYDMLGLYREYRDEDTKKWGGNPYRYLYSICTYDWFHDPDSVSFYIKTLGGVPFLYVDIDGTPDTRYLLEGKDVAKAFFGV